MPELLTLDHLVKTTSIIETKVLDEAEGIVEAFVSVTGIADDVDDIIEPGAYKTTLKERTPRVCWSHDWDVPVGKVLDVKEMLPGTDGLPVQVKKLGGGALWVKTQFNLRTTRGKDAFEDVKFFSEDGRKVGIGQTMQWSIGYTVDPGNWSIDEKTGIRRIKALDLYEVSPVLWGAMDLTSTVAVKDLKARDLMKALAPDAPEPDGTVSLEAFRAMAETLGAKLIVQIGDEKADEVPEPPVVAAEWKIVEDADSDLLPFDVVNAEGKVVAAFETREDAEAELAKRMPPEMPCDSYEAGEGGVCSKCGLLGDLHAKAAPAPESKAGPKVETKIYMLLPGSYEEAIATAGEAACETVEENAVTPAGTKMGYCYIEATFPDRVVVCAVLLEADAPSWNWESIGRTFYEVPYTVTDGQVVCGEPVEVEFSVTVSPKEAAIDIILKTARRLESKEGRVLSAANAEKIKTALQELVDVLAGAGVALDEEDTKSLDDGMEDVEALLLQVQVARAVVDTTPVLV